MCVNSFIRVKMGILLSIPIKLCGMKNTIIGIQEGRSCFSVPNHFLPPKCGRIRTQLCGCSALEGLLGFSLQLWGCSCTCKSYEFIIYTHTRLLELSKSFSLTSLHLKVFSAFPHSLMHSIPHEVVTAAVGKPLEREKGGGTGEKRANCKLFQYVKADCLVNFELKLSTQFIWKSESACSCGSPGNAGGGASCASVPFYPLSDL